MREEKTKYYVIKEKAVPEVLLKVIEAKRLMEVDGYAGAYRAAGNGKSGNQQKLFL